jgi:sodium-independent sulfate anion transporter 11
MTGSALNIAAGQVPSLLGYSSKLKCVEPLLHCFSSSFRTDRLTSTSTRAATYKVIINTLRLLPSTKLDAAFGLTGLFFLYFVRWTLARVERKSKNPVVKRIAFFATTLRTAFVIIILTIASWLTVRHQAKPSISILGTVPSGFKHMGRPSLPTGLMSAIAPELPVSTIILLLEHIVRSLSSFLQLF